MDKRTTCSILGAHGCIKYELTTSYFSTSHRNWSSTWVGSNHPSQTSQQTSCVSFRQRLTSKITILTTCQGIHWETYGEHSLSWFLTRIAGLAFVKSLQFAPRRWSALVRRGNINSSTCMMKPFLIFSKNKHCTRLLFENDTSAENWWKHN